MRSSRKRPPRSADEVVTATAPAPVGPATLYRRFPTKRILATEAFAEQMHACRAVVDEGLAEPDSWRGCCLVIEKLFALHAHSRGFTEAFTAAFPL